MASECEGHGDVYCSDCGATLLKAESKLAAVRNLAVEGSTSRNKAIAELCQEFVRLCDPKGPSDE